MTTDEIKVTAGILIDGMALLSMLSIPVLNWLGGHKNNSTKHKTVKNNFWTITKQEIIDEFKFDKHGY